MVIRLGFEPKTHSLEGCCSIQLSYQTIALTALILANCGCKDTAFFSMCRLYFAKKSEKAFILPFFLPVYAAHRGDAGACVSWASRVSGLHWPGGVISSPEVRCP